MNLLENKISINSPIAQALMGKKVGDVVEVRVPAGVQKYRIDVINANELLQIIGNVYNGVNGKLQRPYYGATD